MFISPGKIVGYPASALWGATKGGLKEAALSTPFRMGLAGAAGFAYGAATTRQRAPTAKAKDAMFAAGIGAAGMALTSPLLMKGAWKGGKAGAKGAYNWMTKPYREAAGKARIQETIFNKYKNFGKNQLSSEAVQGAAMKAGAKSFITRRGLPLLAAGLAIAGIASLGNTYSQNITKRNIQEGNTSTGFDIMETGRPQIHARGPLEASTEGLVQGLHNKRH
jgi:hypothetical protein